MSFADKAKDKAKKNPKVLLSVLVIAHLILISLNRVPGQPNLRYLHVTMTAVMTPFQWLTSQGVATVRSAWSGYFALRGAKQENDWLKTRNSQLETQVLDLREQVKKLDQANSLNQSAAAYQSVNASVIARDANQWFNSVVIDRGALHGVKKDQPVMSVEGGLVGRVIHVTPISARVLLITDERHGAGAVIARTEENRLLGVLKGKSLALCELRFVAAPGGLKNDEQVITSGLDQLYPKGLLIGRIKNLDGSDVIPQAVEVEPAARLERLELVAVLLVSPEEVRRQYDELIREEREKEKQEKSPDRRRR